MAKKGYAENMYGWMKRNGLAQKYEHPGIYCIKINGQIVYIGKSENMLRRIAEHYVGVKQQSELKYRIMAEAQHKGHSVDFDVLYYAQSSGQAAIDQEIGKMEGVYIRVYNPPLNTQIPRAEDWHYYEVKKIDARSVLDSII